MGTSKKAVMFGALIVAIGATMGVSIWTGGATDPPGDPSWSNCGNWLLDFEGDPCYPHAAVHDVLIPFNSDGFDIDLLGGFIGDLSICGTVRFGAEVPTPRLFVTGTIAITGASGGTELTIANGAKIENN